MVVISPLMVRRMSIFMRSTLRQMIFLFFVPPSNEADIKLTGNNGSQFTGTILAPASHTEILGNNGTLALNSQVISYTVKVSGRGRLNITYNEDQNGRAWTNPGVEMVK